MTCHRNLLLFVLVFAAFGCGHQQRAHFPDGAGFTLDQTITGFQLAQPAGELYTFSPSGRMGKSLKGCPLYTVASMPMPGFEEAKGAIARVTKEMQKQGLELVNVNFDQPQIAGYQAFEAEMQGGYSNGKKGVLYFLVLYDEGAHKAVLFTGMDCEGGPHVEKFRATARSIRLKK